MTADTMPSLKGALTRRLLVGLLAIGFVGAIAAYVVATGFANRAYDRSMFDDVQVLANQVRWAPGAGTQIALSPDALLWLLADEGDAVIFRVTDLSNHRVLTSNGDLGDLPDLDIRDNAPYFRFASVGNDRLRVAYVRRPVGTGDVAALVEIGETTRKRASIARSILIGTVSMMSIFILAAVVLVWTGVGTALRPLAALEADAARRSIGNLQPLDPGSAPAEVRGLIDAINHMIGRVVQAIDVQRHFLANAAHQLKTPVAGLRLQAQLALKARSLDEAHVNMVIVERRAAHSGHLIEQLLSLARAESAGGTLAGDDCRLEAIAEETIERLLPDAIRRRVDLGLEHDGAPAVIRANPVLIGELSANLVDNALRYGRHGGRVTIAISHEDGHVLFAVSDDGPGLPESHRELVFRRFWRSDSSVGDGAGLGLAIVEEIAQRYGATVSVASRPAFEGTRVTVRFPAKGRVAGDVVRAG